MRATSCGMLEVLSSEIPAELLREADERNVRFFQLFGHAGTHRTDKERQRKTGYWAECAVKYAFSPNLIYSDSPEVDFLFGSWTFDVKAQGCNSEPRSNFSATLYEEQENRQVDWLIFCRVQNDFDKIWICGLAKKVDYLNKASYRAAGHETNNFRYDQARYELPYSGLHSPLKLVKLKVDHGCEIDN